MLEYIGVTVLVATLLGVVLTAGPRAFSQLPPAFKNALCNVLTAMGVEGCSTASATDRASQLQCLTGRQTREFGYHLTAFSVRADRSLNDRLSVYGDSGGATVTLYDGSGVGVEGIAGADVLSKGRGVSGHVSVIGEYGFRYEFDSEERARDFLDAKRGGLERYAKALVPGSTAIDSGLDFLRHNIGPYLGCESCASDKRVPDAVVAKVGLQAEGNAWAGAGPVSGSARLSLAETGTVTYDLDTHERTFRARVKGQGTAELGVSSARLPVELSGLAGGSGSGAIEVTFGPDGEPKTLTVITKHGYSYGGRAGLDSGTVPGHQTDLSVQQREGRLKVTKARLDLTVPENRAAFERLFKPVGGTVVAPRPQTPGEFTDDLHRLAGRFARDGLFTRYTYSRDLTAGSGGATSSGEIGGRSIRGGRGLAFGAGGKNKTTVIKLRKASVRDMRNPNTHWKPLPTCKLAGAE